MKRITPISILLVMVCLLIASRSSGQETNKTTDGGVSSPDDTPIILSHLKGNDIVKFWTGPDQVVSIVYDQWKIYLFGEVNDTYKVKIRGIEEFNGTLDHQYVNLSFDAGNLDRVRVDIAIGNRSYAFPDIRINHEEIGYDFFNEGKKAGSWSDTDMNIARLKTAFGVILASIITIPIVWKGVRLWRERQGVVQW